MLTRIFHLLPSINPIFVIFGRAYALKAVQPCTVELYSCFTLIFSKTVLLGRSGEE
jgi:hypothetical protein